MTRLVVIFCSTLLCLGCAGDSDKAQWNDFWKDLRGDNMQMRGAFSHANEWGDSSAQRKPAAQTP
jgi:hypothetical protein